MNKKPSVLLVEDDELILKAMKSEFVKSGFVVKTATDGVQALKTLSTWIPSAVVLDILMPKKNGYEVLEKIKSEEALKGMPVLIASNLSQESDLQKGSKLSAAEFFVKSDIALSELIEKTLYYIRMSTHGKRSIGL